MTQQQFWAQASIADLEVAIDLMRSAEREALSDAIRERDWCQVGGIIHAAMDRLFSGMAESEEVAND